MTVLAVPAVLALAGAAPAAAAYPGANGQLAFTSTQDGGARHVFTAGPGGVLDVTGARSSAVETHPRFSPDGREIAVTRQAPGLPNSEIFVMSASGRGRTQITHTSTGNSDPTWSPDGTQLAFVSVRAGGVPDIFVMRSDGSDVRQITHDGAGESELAWSPRGDRIAFVRVSPGGGDRDIWAVKPDGTGLVDLTNDPSSYDLEPAYSPDGMRIAYSGPFHPGRESVGGDLWIMNAGGGGVQPLHHETNGYSDGAYPAWSPDRTTIAFTANDGTGAYHVWSVPPPGGENTELVSNGLPGNPVDEEVDWQARPGSARPHARIVRTTLDRRRHRVSFRFEATGPATGYRCELREGHRRARSRACHSPVTYARLTRGSYTFAVTAFGPGEPYRGATTRRFTIR